MHAQGAPETKEVDLAFEFRGCIELAIALERRRITKEKKIKDLVRKRYSQIASQEQQRCCSSCSCSGANPLSQVEAIGYSAEDLESQR